MTPKEALLPREHETLILIACGLTPIQIAKRMGIEADSVNAYGRRLMAKLGFSERTQATLYALATGIVSLDQAYAVMRQALEEEPNP